MVDRLVKTVPALQAFGCEALQIFASGLRSDHQGERGGIGRNDQILRETALESEVRHTEGAVLIVERRVDGVVSGLGDSPGYAALLCVGDLSPYRRPAGRIEQGVLVARHHQHRHQILEHRTAPRHEDRFVCDAREQSTQCEPAFLR